MMFEIRDWEPGRTLLTGNFATWVRECLTLADDDAGRERVRLLCARRHAASVDWELSSCTVHRGEVRLQGAAA